MSTRGEDEFELSKLRLDPKSAAGAAPVLKRNFAFVIRPWTWVQKLRKAKHSYTHSLADYLLFMHWKGGGREKLRLANSAIDDGKHGLGLSPWEKSRGLRELERLGLVTVDRRFKKSPMVRLHYFD